ncbi:DNA-binding MarR family transcriptional regulator [Haloactinospora alba]|uniref:DNA-binding MarR family transcriptional regulator n=1 Tax=Haloactinospora alba TaxID=405555 RepID=A0A543NMN3_9ACTN|nr:MarR family transcriptional regulator [Haloactinospora alba]TQN33083.1 DNA-binding MarR family transcriptional regulator [Haloactinospora alba]
MTETPPGRRLAESLVRLTHLVEHVFAETGRRYDITPQQAQLLCVLHHTQLGMTELSRSLHLEKSSLTGLVNRVERRGLAVRRRDSHDRRECRVALTEQGSRIAVDFHEEVSGRLEELVGDLAPEESGQLTSVIARVLAGAETEPGREGRPDS